MGSLNVLDLVAELNPSTRSKTLILFNVGYDRTKKEPFFVSVIGMEYNVETHEDIATFTLAELNRFISTLVETRDHFVLSRH